MFGLLWFGLNTILKITECQDKYFDFIFKKKKKQASFVLSTDA